MMKKLSSATAVAAAVASLTFASAGPASAGSSFTNIQAPTIGQCYIIARNVVTDLRRAGCTVDAYACDWVPHAGEARGSIRYSW